VIETTGSATAILVHGGIFYVGNKYTGSGGFVCTGMHRANHSPATDGTTSGTACD
jgi:hypothetical protein